MAKIKHIFQSTIPDGPDTSKVRPSAWNDDHLVPADGILIGDSATNDISGVAIGAPGKYLQSARNRPARGIDFSELSPVMVEDFKFSTTTSSSLSAGTPATVTPTVMPEGITSTSPNNHYIRIVDPVAGNEVVLITARTSSTITFTPSLSHSVANYTLQSASDGLQEAVKWAESQSDGAGVHLPKGFTNLYQRVTFAGVPAVGVFGAGKQASTIVGRFASGDLLYCENSSQLLGLFDFSIGPAVTHTSGAAIHLKDNTGGYPVLQNVRVVQSFIGIWIDGSDFVTLLNCDVNGDPNPNAQDLVLITGGAGDVTIIGGVYMCAEVNDPNMTDYGIRVTGADGITVIGAHVRANIGIGIFPPDGGIVGTVLFEGCIIDRCRTQNISIGTVGTPAVLSNVQFINCHILGGAGIIMEDVDMIIVDTTSMGSVRFGLSFIGCVLANSNKTNVNITGVNTLSIIGCGIANGNSLSGGGSGLRLINCSAVTLAGNTFEDTRSPARQDYGMILGGALSLISISGNVFKNNRLDAVDNLATITNSSIGQNSGLSTNRPTIASASTISVSSLSNTYLITGTTTINTINGSVGGGDTRYLFCPSGLTFSNSGNIANSLTTSAAGQVVTIVWDSVDSRWRIR
jgi:hypothetical protein